MKTLLSLLAVTLIATLQSFAGPEPLPQATPVPVQWYKSGLEVAVSTSGLWTKTNYAQDRYIGRDKAFGGTLDARYWFNEYLGAGFAFSGYDVKAIGSNRHFVGTAPTFAILRYPIGQLAPFVTAGAGAIFNGGNSTFPALTGTIGHRIQQIKQENDVKLVVPVGAGVEYKFTPNLGVIVQGLFDKVDRPQSNFFTVQSGVSYSF